MKNNNKGISLIAIVFIMMFVGALGIVLSERISSKFGYGMPDTSSMDVSRALLYAEAGMEYAKHELLNVKSIS